MGSWSSIDLDGKPADVFDPDRARFAAIYLHDAGQTSLIGNDEFTRLFKLLGLACISPHGGAGWWSDRIIPEFDAALSPERYVVERVLPFAQSRWSLPDRAVGIFGASMGGQGALRIALKHPGVFPVVAGIAPAIEYHQRYGDGSPLDLMYDSKEQCRQDTVPMHIHPSESPRQIYFCCDPSDDEWHRGNDRLHEKFAALGVEHQCDLTTEAGGHSWEYYNRFAEPVLRFLAAGLEHEGRRLL